MVEKAKRFNGNKVEFDDIPLLGILEVAKVTAYGRDKYAKHNWRREAETSQYLNCALRHILKYLYGEDMDLESNCSHIGHAAWNMLALLEKIQLNKDIDDRFKYDSTINIGDLFNISEDIFTTHDGLTDEDLNAMAKEFSTDEDIKEMEITIKRINCKD